MLSYKSVRIQSSCHPLSEKPMAGPLEHRIKDSIGLLQGFIEEKNGSLEISGTVSFNGFLFGWWSAF